MGKDIVLKGVSEKIHKSNCQRYDECTTKQYLTIYKPYKVFVENY